MREGLYVHVEEVRRVMDKLGSRSGTGMLIINEELVLSEIKARSEAYITPSGKMLRKKNKAPS